MNKDSLRKEFERCKTEFTELAAAKALSPENEVLVGPLISLTTTVSMVYVAHASLENLPLSSSPTIIAGQKI